MNTPESSLPPLAPEGSGPQPPRRSGKPNFWEDLVVTGFGFATSTAVAWLSWWMAANWDFAVYTWMANWVIPVGALICGFVAATGYLIGARLFNHRPSRTLLFNIVLVSFSTYFATHYFHYSNDRVNGVPVSHLMSFQDYLVQVTEHMVYKSSHASSNDPGTELGNWGWGIAALQVIGFSLGGFSVYGMLAAVPYCDRCAKYLSEKKSRRAKWKDPESMRAAFSSLEPLMQEGRLQEAITAHAAMGEDRKMGVKANLTMELRKCPSCEHRRLRLTGTVRNGNQWAVVRDLTIQTEQPLQLG